MTYPGSYSLHVRYSLIYYETRFLCRASEKELVNPPPGFVRSRALYSHEKRGINPPCPYIKYTTQITHPCQHNSQNNDGIHPNRPSQQRKAEGPRARFSSSIWSVLSHSVPNAHLLTACSRRHQRHRRSHRPRIRPEHPLPACLPRRP